MHIEVKESNNAIMEKSNNNKKCLQIFTHDLFTNELKHET